MLIRCKHISGLMGYINSSQIETITEMSNCLIVRLIGRHQDDYIELKKEWKEVSLRCENHYEQGTVASLEITVWNTLESLLDRKPAYLTKASFSGTDDEMKLRYEQEVKED